MGIQTASNLITNAFAVGRIDADTARAAQNAIRANSYYGQRMTNNDRLRIGRVRYGIEG